MIKVEKLQVSHQLSKAAKGKKVIHIYTDTQEKEGKVAFLEEHFDFKVLNDYVYPK